MKIEVKFGILTGLCTCLYVMIEYLSGFHTKNIEMGQYSGYLGMVIPVITVILGIKNKRDREMEGYISFGQGIKTGFLICFIAACIITSFFLIYYLYINPDFLNQGLELTRKKLLEEGKSEGEINKMLLEMKGMFSLRNQLLSSFIGLIISGLIISMVVSFFMKRNSPDVNVNIPNQVN